MHILVVRSFYLLFPLYPLRSLGSCYATVSCSLFSASFFLSFTPKRIYFFIAYCMGSGLLHDYQMRSIPPHGMPWVSFIQQASVFLPFYWLSLAHSLNVRVSCNNSRNKIGGVECSGVRGQGLIYAAFVVPSVLLIALLFLPLPVYLSTKDRRVY